MNQDLGSDQWFNWQDRLLQENPECAGLVAKDFPGLLKVQGILFSLSRMHPPEPAIPEIINEIQNLGCSTIILTSRGPDFRNASERELSLAGYNFSKREIKITESERGEFLPYDKTKPDVHGFSAKELQDLPDPRGVSYSNGIMMVAGQHKGVMLKTLLARSPHHFQTIIFVDDHAKHTDRVFNTYKNSDTQIITFRYSREDGNVKRFNTFSKSHVIQQWKKLNSTINTTLVQ